MTKTAPSSTRNAMSDPSKSGKVAGLTIDGVCELLSTSPRHIRRPRR